MDTEVLVELKSWTRTDADIKMMVVGCLTRHGQVNSLDELHERFFDDFANLYDACAELLSQSPLPPSESRRLDR